jgi:predicted protein tyrosine phosphatase
MIESIIITSFAEARHKPFKEDLKQDIWITAIDPEDEVKVKKMKNRFALSKVKHFYQFFRDWSDEDQEPYIKQRLETEGPQEQHINNIISFLEPFVNDDKVHHLGVNCMAGISRSTAIGIIAWVMQGKTPQEALSEILKVRRQAWPNLRMLRLASARVGKDLFNPVLTWKQLNQGIFV